MSKQYIITENQLNSIVNDVVIDNEFELIDKLKKGDQKTLNQFYKKYYPIFYKMITNKTKKFNDDDINQIVSDTLNRAITKINLFDNLGSFDGWLKRILMNTLYDFIKKNKNSPKLPDVLPDVAVSSERDDVGNSYMKLLYDFRNHIPERQFIYIKYYLDGYKHDEIAKLMGTTEGTSRWQVSTGLSKFKRWLINNNLI